jgi:hypothetical protein
MNYNKKSSYSLFIGPTDWSGIQAVRAEQMARSYVWSFLDGGDYEEVLLDLAAVWTGL